MGDEPVPCYPEMPCHMAPLPPGQAPAPDCLCRICDWANRKSVTYLTLTLAGYGGPIRPDSAAWDALLGAAR